MKLIRESFWLTKPRITQLQIIKIFERNIKNNNSASLYEFVLIEKIDEIENDEEDRNNRITQNNDEETNGENISMMAGYSILQFSANNLLGFEQGTLTLTSLQHSNSIRNEELK